MAAAMRPEEGRVGSTAGEQEALGEARWHRERREEAAHCHQLETLRRQSLPGSDSWFVGRRCGSRRRRKRRWGLAGLLRVSHVPKVRAESRDTNIAPGTGQSLGHSRGGWGCG